MGSPYNLILSSILWKLYDDSDFFCRLATLAMMRYTSFGQSTRETTEEASFLQSFAMSLLWFTHCQTSSTGYRFQQSQMWVCCNFYLYKRKNSWRILKRYVRGLLVRILLCFVSDWSLLTVLICGYFQSLKLFGTIELQFWRVFYLTNYIVQESDWVIEWVSKRMSVWVWVYVCLFVWMFVCKMYIFILFVISLLMYMCVYVYLCVIFTFIGSLFWAIIWWSYGSSQGLARPSAQHSNQCLKSQTQ